MDRSTCLFGLILYTNFGDIRIIFVFYLVAITFLHQLGYASVFTMA